MYDKSQSKKNDGMNQPDFNVPMRKSGSLNMVQVETKKWNSNTKNQCPKSNLIDEDMPMHQLTNIKEKPRNQEPLESETLNSARRL